MHTQLYTQMGDDKLRNVRIMTGNEGESSSSIKLTLLKCCAIQWITHTSCVLSMAAAGRMLSDCIVRDCCITLHVKNGVLHVSLIGAVICIGYHERK